MYQYQSLDYGFIILCPERTINALRDTVRSIEKFYDVPLLCIVPKETKKAEIDEMKEVCSTIRGGTTYTSLINKGLQKAEKEWNFIIFAGCFMRPLFYRKYVMFIDGVKDIFFPIVDRKTNFVDGTLNGIFLNRGVLRDIGKLDETSDDLEKAKLVWAHAAVQKGYRFKAILGPKLT